MDFTEYQQAALKTDQPAEPGTDPVVVPMFGLLGEAGSVATAYKKRIRDGAAFQEAKQQIREELGDVLWYLATLADRFDLELEDIAVASLFKVADRWKPTTGEPVFFDEDSPAAEQLPRRAVFTFTPETQPREGRTVIALRCDGRLIGDPLTDASHIDDDYRLHDAFHLAFAAVLGWSPVLRSLMKRKRKSDPQVSTRQKMAVALSQSKKVSLRSSSPTLRATAIWTTSSTFLITNCSLPSATWQAILLTKYSPRCRLGRGELDWIRSLATATRLRRRYCHTRQCTPESCR